MLSFSRVSTPYPAQLHLCSALVWALASALGGPRRRHRGDGDYEKKLNTKGFYTQIGDGEVAGQEGSVW
jgi:hypothetical protein